MTRGDERGVVNEEQGNVQTRCVLKLQASDELILPMGWGLCSFDYSEIIREVELMSSRSPHLKYVQGGNHLLTPTPPTPAHFFIIWVEGQLQMAATWVMRPGL